MKRKARKSEKFGSAKKKDRPEDCRERKGMPKKKLRSYDGNFEKNIPLKVVVQ